MAGLLAAEDEQLADALLVVRRRVHHVRVVGDDALVDAKQVDAAGEGVRAGLEDVGVQRRVLAVLERDLRQLDAAVLDRRRQVLDDRVEQAVGREVAGRHAAGDREQLAVVRAVLQRRDDLVMGDLLALEVALHQRVRDLADLVHELLAVLLGGHLQVVGDRDLGAVLAAGAVVGVRLHVDEVDDPGDLVLGADRDLRRDDVRAEGVLQRLQRAKEVRALAVEHVHEDHAGEVELLRARPQAARRDLDAHHAVDDEDRRLADAHRAERVGDEARLAGRVDEVDLAVVPLKRAERERDRHVARLLVGLGVRHGRAVEHRAEPVGRLRLEEQRLVQRRLAAATVTDKGYVANAVSRLVHAAAPLLGEPRC